MAKNHLDLYTDYLAVSFGQTSATGLSALVDGTISHDSITRFLSENHFTSKDLWHHVKKTVRKIEQDDGVLVFDDTIQAKPFTDENDIMCWHYDHSAGRTVRGINLVNCLYHCNDISIPVAFEIVNKSIIQTDASTGRKKRKAEFGKNGLMRSMITTCLDNCLKFSYVLMDSWYSSRENMVFIKDRHDKDFVCALKSNRLVALSRDDWQKGRFTRISDLDWPEEKAVKVWIKEVAFPVLLVREVFKNRDGSSGTLYLACSDLDVDRPDILQIYQKRWNIEVFHKTLKQNAALAKSPTRRVTTQSNHVFAAILATFKLECVKIKQGMNHFELKGKIYLKAIKAAFSEWKTIKTA